MSAINDIPIDIDRATAEGRHCTFQRIEDFRPIYSTAFGEEFHIWVAYNTIYRRREPAINLLHWMQHHNAELEV